jgi:hypothetical protein
VAHVAPFFPNGIGSGRFDAGQVELRRPLPFDSVCTPLYTSSL